MERNERKNSKRLSKTKIRKTGERTYCLQRLVVDIRNRTWGQSDEVYLSTKINSGDGNVDLTPVIEDYKDALFSWWPLTRYQPMERYWKMRSLITTHLPSAFSDWFYIHRHQ